jgi:hypothetical protein
MSLRRAITLFIALTACAQFVACSRQGQGEACSTTGNDCESPLMCMALPGHPGLGQCCMPNTLCGNPGQGYMPNQDAGEADAGAQADSGAVGEDGSDADAGGGDAGADGGDSGGGDSSAPADGSLDAVGSDAGDAGADAADAARGG